MCLHIKFLSLDIAGLSVYNDIVLLSVPFMCYNIIFAHISIVQAYIQTYWHAQPVYEVPS